MYRCYSLSTIISAIVQFSLSIFINANFALHSFAITNSKYSHNLKLRWYGQSKEASPFSTPHDVSSSLHDVDSLSL